MAQKELHTIMISRVRREMERKMCNPNILGSCITFYQHPNTSDSSLPFLLYLSFPLSFSRNRSSHGEEPHSQWVQHVPFQSLAVVIFQLAKCSLSCHSVTNGWSGLYCTCAALVRRLRALCQSLCLTLFFDTLWWFITREWLDYIRLHCHCSCDILTLIFLHIQIKNTYKDEGTYMVFKCVICNANVILVHHFKIDSEKTRKMKFLLATFFKENEQKNITERADNQI